MTSPHTDKDTAVSVTDDCPPYLVLEGFKDDELNFILYGLHKKEMNPESMVDVFHKMAPHRGIIDSDRL